MKGVMGASWAAVAIDKEVEGKGTGDLPPNVETRNWRGERNDEYERDGDAEEPTTPSA